MKISSAHKIHWNLYKASALHIQGQQTRSHLLQTWQQHPHGMTRHELMQHSGLSYEQVRRQGENLVWEGLIVCQQDGKAVRYFLR
jgi:predicted ArsR family transcriptional regulator